MGAETPRTPEDAPPADAPSAGSPPESGASDRSAAASAAESAGAHESGGTHAEGAGPQVVPIAALPIEEVLLWVLNLLAAKAWEGMGLVANPATAKIQKDVSAARLSIDAYSAVLDLVRPHLEEQPRRDLETLLTTLRINFVDKSSTP